MVIVANVIEVDQATDEIILRTFLLDNATAISHRVALPVVQVLDQDVLSYWLKVDMTCIEVEVLVSGDNLTFGHNDNLGDIDRHLLVDNRGLAYHFGNPFFPQDVIHQSLYRTDQLLDL